MTINNIEKYNKEADQLIKQYESITFEELNQQTIPFLPPAPSHILEIGAGSGRDAGWFATNGYRVTAIEPAVELSKRAQILHPSKMINWLEDSLPHLQLVKTFERTFDLIWLSAVWMHLAPPDRQIAFANLDLVLNNNGKMMFTLRHGPAPEGRTFYPVSVDEILSLAREHEMKPILVTSTEDSFRRQEISWDTIMLVKE